MTIHQILKFFRKQNQTLVKVKVLTTPTHFCFVQSTIYSTKKLTTNEGKKKWMDNLCAYVLHNPFVK